jgi:SNF family Na+-dependent transporter
MIEISVLGLLFAWLVGLLSSTAIGNAIHVIFFLALIFMGLVSAREKAVRQPELG